MKAEERAEVRAEHVGAYESPHGFPVPCGQCGPKYRFPCPTVRLLDALEAAEAENERLRALVLDALLLSEWNQGMRGDWRAWKSRANDAIAVTP